MTEFRRRLRYHQAQWREAHGHPDRVAADRAATRRGGAARREPAAARVRARDRRELPHRRRARGGAGAHVVHRAAPELRPPAAVGRPPVVGGAGVQPLRRPGRRPRAGRPRRAHLVAGRARHRVRRPLRALARPLRSRVPRTASARSTRRSCSTSATGRRGSSASTSKYHERTSRQRAEAERPPAAAGGRRALGRLRAGSDRRRRPNRPAVMWLEHLLLLSMLQHESGAWSWGRYVVVHPAGNADFADACARYARSPHRRVDLLVRDDRGAARSGALTAGDGGAPRAVHRRSEARGDQDEPYAAVPAAACREVFRVQRDEPHGLDLDVDVRRAAVLRRRPRSFRLPEGHARAGDRRAGRRQHHSGEDVAGADLGSEGR